MRIALPEMVTVIRQQVKKARLIKIYETRAAIHLRGRLSTPFPTAKRGFDGGGEAARVGQRVAVHAGRAGHALRCARRSRSVDHGLSLATNPCGIMRRKPIPAVPRLP